MDAGFKLNERQIHEILWFDVTDAPEMQLSYSATKFRPDIVEVGLIDGATTRITFSGFRILKNLEVSEKARHSQTYYWAQNLPEWALPLVDRVNEAKQALR